MPVHEISLRGLGRNRTFIGGFAAYYFGIFQDIFLPIAGILTVVLLLYRDRYGRELPKMKAIG